jgi:hypothetical protein
LLSQAPQSNAVAAQLIHCSNIAEMMQGVIVLLLGASVVHVDAGMSLRASVASSLAKSVPARTGDRSTPWTHGQFPDNPRNVNQASAVGKQMIDVASHGITNDAPHESDLLATQVKHLSGKMAGSINSTVDAMKLSSSKTLSSMPSSDSADAATKITETPEAGEDPNTPWSAGEIPHNPNNENQASAMPGQEIDVDAVVQDREDQAVEKMKEEAADEEDGSETQEVDTDAAEDLQKAVSDQKLATAEVEYQLSVATKNAETRKTQLKQVEDDQGLLDSRNAKNYLTSALAVVSAKVKKEEALQRPFHTKLLKLRDDAAARDAKIVRVKKAKEVMQASIDELKKEQKEVGDLLASEQELSGEVEKDHLKRLAQEKAEADLKKQLIDDKDTVIADVVANSGSASENTNAANAESSASAEAALEAATEAHLRRMQTEAAAGDHSGRDPGSPETTGEFPHNPNNENQASAMPGQEVNVPDWQPTSSTTPPVVADVAAENTNAEVENMNAEVENEGSVSEASADEASDSSSAEQSEVAAGDDPTSPTSTGDFPHNPNNENQDSSMEGLEKNVVGWQPGDARK